MRLDTIGRALGRLALVLAIVALVAVALPGPANRFGLFGFRTGFRLLGYGAYAALAAARSGAITTTWSSPVIIARPGAVSESSRVVVVMRRVAPDYTPGLDDGKAGERGGRKRCWRPIARL